MIPIATHGAVASYTPPSLWTPANISTSLWLDADDSSTITLVSGNVSEWRDKSGNNRHATQGTASQRPTTSTFNSRNSILFQGFRYFDIPNNWFNNLSALCCYAVADIPTSSNWRVILGLSFTTGGAFVWFASIDSQIYADGRRVSSDSYVTRSVTYSTTPFIAGFERNFSAASQNLGVNGTWNTQSFATSGTTGTPSFIFTRIGAYNSNDPYKDGKIGEIIVLTSMPTTATREKIEGYLAHKWGLTANLPSSHPYKNSPP